MDPLFAIGAFLVGAVLGRVQAHATFEPVLQDLRRQVHAALGTVAELEAQEQPKIEARILERMYGSNWPCSPPGAGPHGQSTTEPP
jgi:hypothetical protein